MCSIPMASMRIDRRKAPHAQTEQKLFGRWFGPCHFVSVSRDEEAFILDIGDLHHSYLGIMMRYVVW